MDAFQTSQAYHETSVLTIYLLSMSPNLQPLNFDFKLSIFVKTLWRIACLFALDLDMTTVYFTFFYGCFMCSVVHYCGSVSKYSYIHQSESAEIWNVSSTRHAMCFSWAHLRTYEQRHGIQAEAKTVDRF